MRTSMAMVSYHVSTWARGCGRAFDSITQDPKWPTARRRFISRRQGMEKAKISGWGTVVACRALSLLVVLSLANRAILTRRKTCPCQW
jgi:hypothetical protein